MPIYIFVDETEEHSENCLVRFLHLLFISRKQDQDTTQILFFTKIKYFALVFAQIRFY